MHLKINGTLIKIIYAYVLVVRPTKKANKQNNKPKEKTWTVAKSVSILLMGMGWIIFTDWFQAGAAE